MKRGLIGDGRAILGAAGGTEISATFALTAENSNAAGDQFNMMLPPIGAFPFYTNALFRDPTAWCHCVFQFDSANATQSERTILWVNGVRQTSAVSTCALNQTCALNGASGVLTLGKGTQGYGTSRDYFDGLFAEMYLIDGQLVAPSAFGTTNSATNQWVPIKYAGTYGTNGFYLDFSDNSGATSATLGKDRSGNNNDFTPLNFSVAAGVGNDSLTDTPTDYHDGLNGRGNYCTWNAVWPSTSLLSNGNLDAAGLAGGTQSAMASNAYWEITAAAVGVEAGTITASGGITSTVSVPDATTFGFRITTAGALDYRNVTGAGAWTSLTTGLTAAIPYVTGAASVANFGQRPFSGAIPATHVALNSQTLPGPPILKSTAAFDAALYTGTGAALSVTGKLFTPDLVILKDRTAINHWAWYDASRAVQKELVSSAASAETTEAQGLTAFTSDGFTIGSLAKINTNTNAYVAQLHRAGAAYGLDIVLHTGDNTANRNISHALGVAPKFVLTFRRDTGADHWVWHQAMTNATYFAPLNGPAAQANANTPWGTGNFSSTQFMVTNNATNNTNATGGTYVTYLFTGVSGLSFFGSYVGNGLADGPVVSCGLRPKLVLAKRIDSTGDWYVWDALRNTYNPLNFELLMNSSAAQATAIDLDFLASGFKLRAATAGFNSGGGTYIYASFAGATYKYARAL